MRSDARCLPIAPTRKPRRTHEITVVRSTASSLAVFSTFDQNRMEVHSGSSPSGSNPPNDASTTNDWHVSQARKNSFQPRELLVSQRLVAVVAVAADIVVELGILNLQVTQLLPLCKRASRSCYQHRRRQ